MSVAPNRPLLGAEQHNKTHGRENDKPLQRAVRRMEKRLELLQYRRLTLRRRSRSRAWEWYQFTRGVRGILQGEVACPYCKFEICFGEFLKAVELRGNTCDIIRFDCPACGTLLMYNNQPTSDCKIPDSIPTNLKIHE